jgi:hypothetical protein
MASWAWYLLAAVAWRSEEPILLGVGQRFSIDLEPGWRVEENCAPFVSFLEASGRSLQLSGVKPGRCHFLMGGKSPELYEVIVLEGASQRSLEGVRYVLHMKQWSTHVSVRAVAGKLVLTGTVGDETFYRALRTELSPFENISYQLQLAPSVIPATVQFLNQQLHEAGYVSLHAEYVSGDWRLQGRHTLADPLLDPGVWMEQHFWPMQSYFATDLTGHPQFLVDVTFHEIRKSEALDLGVSWPDLVNFVVGHAGVSAANTLLLGQGSPGGSLQWTGHMLQTQRFSRLLAHPKLTCVSGEKVAFHSGGSFPVEYRTRNYASTDWKIHGLKMELVPKWDPASRKVKSELMVTYSLPVARAGSSTPELQESTLSTFFEAAPGETILLTGFNQSQENRLHEGLPWSAKLPWIRWFTGRERRDSTDTELVIQVTTALRPST